MDTPKENQLNAQEKLADETVMPESKEGGRASDGAAEKNETEKLDSPKSRSESIRERLRAQERRLTSLVRQASGDGMDSVLGQMKTVQASLKQVEAEKSELENELSRLKHMTEDDEFLKEKMAGIQDGFDKQVKKIQQLLEELGLKNDEIDSLRTELVRKLQRIVELEFDLETHEIHFTDYAKEQFKLGEEALAEIKLMDFDGHESFSSVGSSNGKQSKKAQKLISKLLTDLDNLELRFKEQKLKSSSALQKAQLENEDLYFQIQILKERIGEKDDDSDSSDKFGLPLEQQNIYQLRRRAETSEAKKRLYRKEAVKLRGAIDELKREAEEDSKRSKMEIEKWETEVEALKARVAQLESKSGGKLIGRKKNKADEVDKFAGVEKRIEDSYSRLVRLEASIEIKDKQIATLKKEVANLRMKDIYDGNTKGTIYSESDTDLLRGGVGRSAMFRITGSGEDGEDDNVTTALRRQLQEAQQQLVKKDQELVIERAKAASTAAGLLARITEITGKKADSKYAKQVPSRFYL